MAYNVWRYCINKGMDAVRRGNRDESREVSTMKRDGTTEQPEQGKKHFPCSADHERDWHPCAVDSCRRGNREEFRK